MKYAIIAVILFLTGCDKDYVNQLNEVKEPSLVVSKTITHVRHKTPNQAAYYVDEFTTPSGIHCVKAESGLSCDFSKAK